MSLSRIIFRRCSIACLFRVSLYPSSSSYYGCAAATARPLSSASSDSNWTPRPPLFSQHFTTHSSAAQVSEDDGSNDFLSRFVWIMCKKLTEAYPECDKILINGMLEVIADKILQGDTASIPSEDFSEDLWRTVFEVKSVVLRDMEKERKKEKLKSFLQSEEVKEWYRFAGEVGIRGDMLRELRFKWAREKMEESERHQRWERRCKEEEASCAKSPDENLIENEDAKEQEGVDEDDQKTVSLPKRHGKINYKIYGLNLSDPRWTDVADKIHESAKVLWPKEPKPISGKCQLVTDEILSLKEEDDPTPLLGEWMELQQPGKLEWIAFLDRLKERNPHQSFKIAEHVLDEESFETNIYDYSRLIGKYAKLNRLKDAERVLNKMTENGIVPDAITSTIVIHMYCKAGNLGKAKEAFEGLRTCGVQPDMKVYSSMIKASVNADEPSLGESLMREMETRDINPTLEIYMALLRSYAKRGDAKGAQRISMTMQFAGFQQSMESFSLMVEACVEANDSVQAKVNFDQMIQSGLKPDDRCLAAIIAAYEQNNELGEALKLLLELEKDGFEPGIATYTNMVDWFAKMELIDEAEQIVDRIAELREAPPLKLHVSLCDMYSKAGFKEKVLQAIGVLESKSDQLVQKEFERIIESLAAGGFTQDAQKFQGLMEARGFTPSDKLLMNKLASQVLK